MEITWIIDSSVLLRLIMAVLLGGLVGIEREIHGRPAGFRTHVVVCLGATMMMIASDHIISSANGDPVFNVNRMAAGIITGIGFLGAGAIIREENVVRGLTTAGCVWFIAGLGIVIGKELYPLALWSTLLVLIMLIFFRFVESWVNVQDFRDITIKVDLEHFEPVQKRCMKVFETHRADLDDKTYRINNSLKEVEMTFALKVTKKSDPEPLLTEIGKWEGVIEVRG